MRIAILGTRGVPARYGGFETFAEELSARLVARGHEVTVFGRRRFFERYSGPSHHRGARIVSTPTIMHKYLETPVHALTSFIATLRLKFDMLLLCNAANAPIAPILKLKQVPLCINVDGIERNRKKWNKFGKLWYRLGEWAAVNLASKIISDADVIRDYYRDTYSIDSVVIPYGVDPKLQAAGDTLASFNLHSKQYLLYVSRLEPENNALGVIEAYAKLTTTMPLVIVGDAPYATAYKARLRKAAEGLNVIFTGFQFGQSYQEFQSNAYLYIQATEVGGTHPALVEAMSYGNAVVVNGTPENLEVIGEAGLSFRKNNFSELSSILEGLLSDPQLVNSLGEQARERVLREYSWDSVVDKYEGLFRNLSRI